MRWIAIFGIALATFVGCSLDDTLEDAPCNDDADCASGQACVRTVHQNMAAEPGLCRSDGGCAVGEQEGCLAGGDGTCSGMAAICDAMGLCFCCSTADASIANIAADSSSAQCVSCPMDLCMGNGDASETCSEGEDRCVVVEGEEPCGCRVPDNLIENSACEDDFTCGAGFVCTRTFEQIEEPLDTEEPDQEPGLCRPEDAPGCASEIQHGCETEGSCGSGMIDVCAGTRCYCCEVPANEDEFNVHVYAEDIATNSAACIDCPDNCGMGEVTCTKLENDSCDDGGMGGCGCMPSM